MEISANTWEVRTCRSRQSRPNFLLDDSSAYAIVDLFYASNCLSFKYETSKFLLKLLDQCKFIWFSVVKKCEERNPCQHNATCIDLGEDKYECKCHCGFRGKHCENGEYKYLLLTTLSLSQKTTNKQAKQIVSYMLLYVVMCDVKKNLFERLVAVQMKQFAHGAHNLCHLSLNKSNSEIWCQRARTSHPGKQSKYSTSWRLT